MKPLALDLFCGIWEGGWANGLVKAGWDVIGVDIEDQGGYVGHKILADVREIAKDPEKYFPALRFDLIVASPPCQIPSHRALPFGKARFRAWLDRFRFKLSPADLKLALECDPLYEPFDEATRPLWEAAFSLAKFYKVPLVLENVSGARRYMGSHSWKYGSFYFWGSCPPARNAWNLKPPKGSPKKGFGKTKDGNYQSRGKKGPVNGLREIGGDRKSKFGWNKPEVQDARRINSPFATPSERVNTMRGPEMSAQRDAYKPMVGSVKYKKIHGAEQVGTHGGNLRKRWSAKVAMIPEELSYWIGECFYPQELKTSGTPATQERDA